MEIKARSKGPGSSIKQPIEALIIPYHRVGKLSFIEVQDIQSRSISSHLLNANGLKSKLVIGSQEIISFSSFTISTVETGPSPM